MRYNFFMPTEIFSGENCILHHAENAHQLGKRCFLITGGAGVQHCGILADLFACLEKGKIPYLPFFHSGANPTLEDCREAAKAAREFDADFIIGAGGGSVLDVAKTAAVLAKNFFLPEEELFSGHFAETLPFALAATTAGTGGEVTDWSMVTCDKTRRQILKSPLLFARYAFCDPRYTYSLPETPTVSSALFAFSAALEAYFSKNATDLSDIIATRAVTLLFHAFTHLRRFGFSSLDHMLRDEIYLAATYSGIASGSAGSCFPFSMALSLSELFDLPQGIARGLFLSPFLEWCDDTAGEKMHRLLQLLSLNSLSPLLELIDYFTRIDLHLGRNAIEKMVLQTSNTYSAIRTPGSFNREAARKVLIRIFLGDGDGEELGLEY